MVEQAVSSKNLPNLGMRWEKERIHTKEWMKNMERWGAMQRHRDGRWGEMYVYRVVAGSKHRHACEQRCSDAAASSSPALQPASAMSIDFQVSCQKKVNKVADRKSFLLRGDPARMGIVSRAGGCRAKGLRWRNKQVPPECKMRVAEHTAEAGFLSWKENATPMHYLLLPLEINVALWASYFKMECGDTSRWMLNPQSGEA